MFDPGKGVPFRFTCCGTLSITERFFYRICRGRRKKASLEGMAVALRNIVATGCCGDDVRCVVTVDLLAHMY